MGLRLTATLVLLAITAGSASAADLPPREIWPQATNLARDGDYEAATAKVGELLTTGKAYGLKSFPVYATAAASMGNAAQDKPELLAWTTSTANALDPASPGVAFAVAERAAAQKDWMTAARAMAAGFANVIRSYRTRVLARADLLLVVSGAIALTAIVFALALFIRYGRSMAHDFREMLGTRLHGGSVSVLAFALLFLPVFLWLGPMWLVIYWFIIFFGYANGRERTVVLILALLVAAAPLITDLVASWIAGVESPVIVSAISSADKSYQPDALRRMQELIAVVPDDPTLQILAGNLNVFEGNELQAADHYRRAIQISDAAGAHVNLGNLHFLQSDYPAALTEYSRAEERDESLAIAYYNSSVANGELYRFDQQGQKLEQAKRVDPALIERLTNDRPTQKIAMYYPPISEAWAATSRIASQRAAPSLFGTYASFDPMKSAANPVTIGALATLIFAPLLWMKRRRAGFAGSCIKCGRTFCHRCKSARESSTYCTQCIHIYLKRDGVALATKRAKLDEVSDYSASLQRRNRLLATFIPGSAQLLEGRTIVGLLGLLLFFLFVLVAIFIGRLAPAIGPVADATHLAVRIVAVAGAVVMWFLMSMPVYRRRAVA